jgi:thiamine phosphate synthase YjbQ (UPF0047 family)
LSGRRAKKPIHDGSQKNELNGYVHLKSSILGVSVNIPITGYQLKKGQVFTMKVMKSMKEKTKAFIIFMFFMMNLSNTLSEHGFMLDFS